MSGLGAKVRPLGLLGGMDSLRERKPLINSFVIRVIRLWKLIVAPDGYLLGVGHVLKDLDWFGWLVVFIVRVLRCRGCRSKSSFCRLDNNGLTVSIDGRDRENSARTLVSFWDIESLSFQFSSSKICYFAFV